MRVTDAGPTAADEDRDLAIRARSGDAGAEGELCRRMLGLAYHQADRFRGPLDRDDARGVASLALVRAIRGWEPARGTLASYVARAVWYEVRSARGQSGSVSVPPAAVRAWRADAAGRLTPGLSERSQARYAADAGRAFAAASLDAPREDGRPAADSLAACGPEGPDPDDLAALAKEVDALPEPERATIVARYGLDGRPPRQLGELATEAGRTKQAIHFREKRALGRLRRALAPGG